MDKIEKLTLAVLVTLACPFGLLAMNDILEEEENE